MRRVARPAFAGVSIAALATSLLLASATIAGAAPPPAELLAAGASGELVEDACRLEVAFDGPVGVVVARHRLRAIRGADAEAIYRFHLPASAAVTALTVTLPGGSAAIATAIDARAAVAPVLEPAHVSGRPDVAVLRQIAWPATVPPEEVRHLVRYELRVYPVGPDGVDVLLRWTAPARTEEGRQRLEVPGRGAAPGLAVPELRVAAARGTDGPTEVVADGALLPRAPGGGFRASGGGDLYVSAPAGRAPRGANDGLQAILAVAPLGAGTSAVALSLAATPPRAEGGRPGFARLVLVVDTSRSLAPAGRAAARELARAVLDAVAPATQVEAVLFDRRPRRALGRLAPNAPAARARIDEALAAAPRANGSDLGAALDEVRRILPPAAPGPSPDPTAPREPSSLVVLVTDGLVPLGLDGRRALDRLGDDVLDDTHLVVVILHPEGTPAPPGDAPAAQLARLAGGRLLIVRDVDAARRRRELAAELARPAPFSHFEWERPDERLELALPDEVAPGDAVLLLGQLHGDPPRELALRVMRRGKPLRLVLRPGPGALQRALLPWWLAAAGLEDLLPPYARGPQGGGLLGVPEETRRDAARRYLEAAAAARVASAATALVALDPRDAFARDRLAAVRRWGPTVFQRLSPPPEREEAEAPHRVAAREPAWWRPDARPAPRRREATGALDAAIVERVLQTRVLPAAKGCYDVALRRVPSLAGALELTVELARGEVVAAAIDRSTFPPGEDTAALARCVLDAAYAIDVPAVSLGDDPDEVTLARYPLRFRVEDARVTRDRSSAPPPATSPDDPLDGLPR